MPAILTDPQTTPRTTLLANTLLLAQAPTPMALALELAIIMHQLPVLEAMAVVLEPVA
jgi:hypothetical protein